MRDEECFTPLAEDETSVDHAFDALRAGFKELYKEIDYLGEQATLTVQSITRHDADVLQKSDIEDLIVYARKFVRETRKTIVSFDEHGVQCEPAKQSNKKVSTPKAWLQPEPEKCTVRAGRWESPFRDQRAITVTQDIPLNVSNELSDQAEQLNNKVTVATAPEVRSIGTNVNFVSQRTVVKRTNVPRVVQPAIARSAKCTSAVELRPRPAVKPRAPPTTAPVVTSCKQGKPTGRTFSDDQFKLLFERFIQMQAAKNSTEAPQTVSQDTPAIIPEQVIQATISNEQNDELAVSIEGKENGQHNEISDKAHKEPIGYLPCQEYVPESVDSDVETLGFTSHVLPSVSIKGRWDLNLKVQQTGNIAILDEKEKPCDEHPNRNVLYVELKRGQTRNMKENILNEKQLTVTNDTKKDDASELSKLREAKEDPCILSEMDFSESDFKTTNDQKRIPCELPQIRIPRSARNVIRQSNTPNKYLDPFVNKNRRKAPSKKDSEVLFDAFDDDSSTSTDYDFGEDEFEEEDVRLLLNLKDNENKTVHQTVDIKSPNTEHVKKLPTSVQCQRSFLEVSSIPALQSPPELSRGNESSESEHETASNGHSSRHFLNNLRIWKSALEAQSQNMKITNELTENLDFLKDNIEKIAQESTKVAQITKRVENTGVDEGILTTQRVPARAESSTLRSRSCECFGCQNTFEEPALRPMTSPTYGHKQFQRTLFEHNPRYAKTIRRIYQLGSSERQPSSAGVDRDETVKKAAQKFLLSLQANVNRQNCYSSGSSGYGLVNSPSKSISSGFDVLDGADYSTASENEYYSEPEPATVSSSTCAIPYSSDSRSNVSSAEQVASSEGTDLSSLTINIRSVSDMGEILSPGEIN